MNQNMNQKYSDTIEQLKNEIKGISKSQKHAEVIHTEALRDQRLQFEQNKLDYQKKMQQQQASQNQWALYQQQQSQLAQQQQQSAKGDDGKVQDPNKPMFLVMKKDGAEMMTCDEYNVYKNTKKLEREKQGNQGDGNLGRKKKRTRDRGIIYPNNYFPHPENPESGHQRRGKGQADTGADYHSHNCFPPHLYPHLYPDKFPELFPHVYGDQLKKKKRKRRRKHSRSSGDEQQQEDQETDPTHRQTQNPSPRARQDTNQSPSKSKTLEKSKPIEKFKTRGITEEDSMDESSRTVPVVKSGKSMAGILREKI